MPRISKRIATGLVPAVPGNAGILYKAAIYARLSCDTDEKKNGSIDSQTDIAKGHLDSLRATEERVELEGVYIDLGETGTNFKRDGFERMMQGIKAGNINCVIVKDLSRFGRNHIEAGNYIEKIFPFLGIRFIAVTDGFDTAAADAGERKISMNIKNLVNDMYAGDCSEKTRLQIRQRQDRGAYIGGAMPYGYTHDEGDRDRKPIVHPETGAVVRLMFDLYLEKKSLAAVARELTRRRINPPTVYWRTREVYCAEGQEQKEWCTGGVMACLRNEAHIGTMVLGQTSCDRGSYVRNDPSTWTRRENNHEATVDADVFKKAQELLAAGNGRRSVKKPDGGATKESIHAKVIHCGICGLKLERSTQTRRLADGTARPYENYRCPNSRDRGLESRCPCKSISGTDLDAILIAALKKEFAPFLEKPRKYTALNDGHGTARKKELEDLLYITNRDMARRGALEGDLYRDYRENRISTGEYADMKAQHAAERERLEREHDILARRLAAHDGEAERRARAVAGLMRFKKTRVPDRELLDVLVKKICLLPDKRVEISYSFDMGMMEGMA